MLGRDVYCNFKPFSIWFSLIYIKQKNYKRQGFFCVFAVFFDKQTKQRSQQERYELELIEQVEVFDLSNKKEFFKMTQWSILKTILFCFENNQMRGVQQATPPHRQMIKQTQYLIACARAIKATYCSRIIQILRGSNSRNMCVYCSSVIKRVLQR